MRNFLLCVWHVYCAVLLYPTIKKIMQMNYVCSCFFLLPLLLRNSSTFADFRSVLQVIAGKERVTLLHLANHTWISKQQ